MMTLLAALAATAWRNPSTGGEEIIVLSLLIEIPIVVSMAGDRLHRWLLGGAWAVLTVITWLAMMLTLVSLPDQARRTGAETIVLVAILELAVILVEGAALRGMSTLSLFRKPGAEPFGWRRALVISAVANGVSLGLPLLLILLLGTILGR